MNSTNRFTIYKMLKVGYTIRSCPTPLRGGRLGKDSSDPFQYEMAKAALDGQTTLWKQKCESVIRLVTVNC
jgi:hypothetical protein